MTTFIEKMNRIAELVEIPGYWSGSNDIVRITDFMMTPIHHRPLKDLSKIVRAIEANTRFHFTNRLAAELESDSPSIEPIFNDLLNLEIQNAYNYEPIGPKYRAQYKKWLSEDEQRTLPEECRVVREYLREPGVLVPDPDDPLKHPYFTVPKEIAKRLSEQFDGYEYDPNAY